MQDDPGNLCTHRQDEATHETWKSLKRELESDLENKWASVAKKCSKEGINIQSLLSGPNWLWELLSFASTRQLVVDIFHNLHEGHCNEFYKFFRIFTPEAKRLTQANWNDPNLWSPDKGKDLAPTLTCQCHSTPSPLTTIAIHCPHVFIPSDPFPSPFDERAGYNGHEKFLLACHGDLLLRWMVDGTVKEEDLPSMVMDKQSGGKAAGGNGGKASTSKSRGKKRRRRATSTGGASSNTGAAEEEADVSRRDRDDGRDSNRVPTIGRRLITANLLDIKGTEAKGMSAKEWKASHQKAAPSWKAIYYDYVVPLAELCRALSVYYNKGARYRAAGTSQEVYQGLQEGFWE